MIFPRQRYLQPARWLACGFGAGMSPAAPGTVGSVLALPLYWAVSDWPWWACVVGWTLLFALGAASVHACLPLFDGDDPGAIVIDEVAGALLAFLALPAGWLWLAAAFALFRLFDIFKPWPISWAERRFKGAFGIMLDDVLAGLGALALIQIAAFGLSLAQRSL